MAQPRDEMLVAFSCKQRELCPSCAAERGCVVAVGDLRLAFRLRVSREQVA